MIDCQDPDRTVSKEPNIHSGSFNNAEQFPSMSLRLLKRSTVFCHFQNSVPLCQNQTRTQTVSKTQRRCWLGCKIYEETGWNAYFCVKKYVGFCGVKYHVYKTWQTFWTAVTWHNLLSTNRFNFACWSLYPYIQILTAQFVQKVTQKYCRLATVWTQIRHDQTFWLVMLLNFSLY